MTKDQISQDLAQKILDSLLKKAQKTLGLQSLGPKKRSWKAQVSLVSAPKMTRLNRAYRRKSYPTDILSFGAPQMISKHTGYLGDLVICSSVLRKQARELGHSNQAELRVLTAHGILHLLGLDHERGPKEAQKMAQLEQRLLGKKPLSGLIDRSASGNR